MDNKYDNYIKEHDNSLLKTINQTNVTRRKNRHSRTENGNDSRSGMWNNVSQRTLAPHLKMLREIYLTQNSIHKKNTYHKKDKILSQTHNKIASPPTDQCNKKCFLKRSQTWDLHNSSHLSPSEDLDKDKH